MLSPALRDSREVIPFLHRAEANQETKSVSRTVFDVGMNNGDDSAYYLSKGCKVIAVEANPILVQRARVRFRAEIAAGQMVIEPLGIWDHPGKIPFWINEERDVFSSFDRTRASRGGMKCRSVDVDCVTLRYATEKARCALLPEDRCGRRGATLPHIPAVDWASKVRLSGGRKLGVPPSALATWIPAIQDCRPNAPQFPIPGLHERQRVLAVGEACVRVCRPLQE